jgi:hypothetical protein
MLKHVVRAGVETAPLLLAGILALAGALPTNASQKVALPNGEVLHFGAQSGHTHKPKTSGKTSLEIAENENGISSIVWHIVAGRNFEWDESNHKYSRNAVIRWLNSAPGERYVLAKMTDTRNPFGVFPNGLRLLNDEFGLDRLPELNEYITQHLSPQ